MAVTKTGRGRTYAREFQTIIINIPKAVNETAGCPLEVAAVSKAARKVKARDIAGLVLVGHHRILVIPLPQWRFVQTSEHGPVGPPPQRTHHLDPGAGRA